MQNSHSVAQACADDEISLLELWQILMNRKWLILLCFFACIGVGAGYAFYKAPVYEASISLRIGHIQTPALLLESPAELVTRLTARNGSSIRAVISKSSSNIINITALAPEAAEAAAKLQFVVQDVIKSHTDVFNGNIKPVFERLNQINNKRQALEHELSELGRLVEQLKAGEPAQASLMVMQRSEITNSIQQLDAERLHLTQQLLPPQTRPTELLGEVVAPTKPSKPQKILVLALAATLGLMAGVMLAFIAEFVSKANNRKA